MDICPARADHESVLRSPRGDAASAARLRSCPVMTTDVPDTTDLLAAASDPHTHALQALDDGEAEALVAVGWCSAHLAAADCVLYSAVQRRIPNGRRQVRAARSGDRALQQALCRLDRRLTGAVHLVDVPVAHLAEQVRERLLAHADTERHLVQSLQAVLDPGEQQQLVRSLIDATSCAPTRPHPHLRHTPLAALVARVGAAVDRARDVLDNRVAPTGAPPVSARPAGRWGCYLMGVPSPQREQVGSR
jgi:hypothetical protein